MNVMLSSMSKIKKPIRYGGKGDDTDDDDEEVDYQTCRFAPNDFYHIISDLIALSNHNVRQTRKYYILVVLISNDHINVRETISKLVEASQQVFVEQ